MKIRIEPVKFARPVKYLYQAWVKTLRFEVEGYELRPGEPGILALWHQEVFFPIWVVHKRCPDSIAMVSPSKDGDFLARVFELFGHSPIIRGSSSRDGIRALLQATKIIARDKRYISFAVDGPKGPPYVPKDGIFVMAQRAKAPIIPVRGFADKRWMFEKAWDKTIVPHPFSKVALRVGEPYYVTEEKLTAELLEQERERLIKGMMDLGPVAK